VSEAPTAIDKVAWILVRDRSVLSTRSIGKDTYYLPGGKREAGEADLECLSREIREELSVELVGDTARSLGEFTAQAHGHARGTSVTMRCYECEFVGELKPAAEIAEIIWLGYRGRARSSPVDKLVFDHLRSETRL
jgi:8-oxo-dGTP diphosphatase